jgi:hypothetical protein
MEHKINWDKIALYVVVMIAFIYLISVLKELKPQTDVLNTTLDTSEIEKLIKEKDSLVNAMDKLQLDYEYETNDRINNITNSNNNKQNEINNIPNLRNVERDSIWSILLTSKDSLPQRYWDLLEQTTRRKGT